MPASSKTDFDVESQTCATLLLLLVVILIIIHVNIVNILVCFLNINTTAAFLTPVLTWP